MVFMESIALLKTTSIVPPLTKLRPSTHARRPVAASLLEMAAIALGLMRRRSLKIDIASSRPLFYSPEAMIKILL
ncbi:MAG: hypothetical protein HC840_17965 [Leptolyngbyaceae cyanobacterium RM2_2_4]|nr:hypothetical protein [Leptolyngbyaceae cyanobacterium SM1_4_3]NJO51016.1 hypothetical protein [Leptolyngbyaceae cyanobacterium RM2_2_4]